MATRDSLVFLRPLLLLLLLLLPAGVQMCVSEEGCEGGRPPTPNGCCPLGVGEECGEEVEVGVQCDAELGHRCVDNEGTVTTQRGLCAGQFNLHATETGRTTVTLQWNDYIPEDYYFEYVLLFRKDSFREDTADWELWDIGTQPLYTVSKLDPGTLYFFRVALWADDRATVLGNLSEAVWVVTDEATNCSHNGEEYQVGQVVDNCEDRCTCTGTGHMHCTPSCPESSLPEVPEGCALVFEEECSCNATVTCRHNETESPGEEEEDCLHNGTSYRVGATFTSGCSLCVCGSGRHVNCSFTSCPQLELPFPSILCPNPHVRRDGCCDNVYCLEENPDPQALIRRLMALSFAPDTLTISFSVDHVTSSASVTQDRYEVMTSDGRGGAASWSSRTYTPTTLTADDNVSSPSDLLHSDAAIRVDDRVYLTLDGLRPNTTYYVRVEPVVKRDMGVTESVLNSTLTGFFVARTMDIDVTCQVGNVPYQDGDVISDNCEEVCKCVSGDVMCQRACPEDQLVMVPGKMCPRPRLVPSDHSCCKTWRCFPDEDGCVYKSTVLKHEDVVYEGACGPRCKCTFGEVTCTPVCPPESPAPRSACVLTNVTSSCCPVWMCPEETKPPTGLSLASQIGFHGNCSSNDTFRTSLRKALEDRIDGHLPCADRESSFFVRCWISDVVVTCPRHDGYRKRRQTPEIELVAVIAANITESVTESKIQASFNETARAVSSLFTSGSVVLRLDTRVHVTASGGFRLLGVSHLCSAGFVYRPNVCVAEYLYSPSNLLLNGSVSMTVASVSPRSATLTWPRLPRHWTPYVTAVVLEFRVTSSAEWTRAMTLDLMTQNHTLRTLSASEQYEARLVAMTISPSKDRVVLSTVHFATTGNDALHSALTLDSLQVTLDVRSVTLTWPALPGDVRTAVSALKVTYRQSQSHDNGDTRVLGPRATQVTLTGLEPEKTYVSKVEVHLVNETTVTMASLHFVTKATETSVVPVIPLLALCAVLVLLSVLIPVAFFVWRRMRRKSSPETAFENRTFGVNITSLCATRAKNDCARPQDTENGSAVAGSSGVSDCPQQA